MNPVTAPPSGPPPREPKAANHVAPQGPEPRVNTAADDFGIAVYQTLNSGCPDCKGMIALDKSILVVDDEKEILDLIEGRLTTEGYRVVRARSFGAASRKLAEEPFDIVILDVGLPDGSGLDLVQKIRKTSTTGIIVVSGRGEVADRVVGLEVGADDYIVKPFHLRDLLARVRALARRLGDVTAVPQIAKPTSRRFCGYEIDPKSRSLRVIDGPELYLTSREFEVLWTLVENAPMVLTREAILNAAFGVGHEYGGRPVDVLISRLREKLFPDGSGHLRIRTVRGRGYQLLA